MNYQEFDAIHEKLQEYDDKHHSNFALFVEILRESGVRWGQMSELKFSMIDFAEHSLTFTRENMKTKNKSVHKVIVDDVIITKLYRLHEKNENADHKREFVFCSTVNQNRIFSRTTFYNAFYGAQDALGYTDKDGKGKDVYKFRPHDLKRTFIMESLDFGYDRAEIKAMTNNTSDIIFDGYVGTRRIKKLVSNRRATRQAIIDESKKEVERLKQNVESGVWSLDKLDEMEKIIKEKKARILEKEGMEKFADNVVDVEV
jgi:integrase